MTGIIVRNTYFHLLYDKMSILFLQQEIEQQHWIWFLIRLCKIIRISWCSGQHYSCHFWGECIWRLPWGERAMYVWQWEVMALDTDVPWKRAESTPCSLFLIHLTLHRKQDNRELKIDTSKMWLTGNIIQNQYICVHTPWPGQYSDVAVGWTIKELKFSSLEEQEVFFFPNVSRPTPGLTKPPFNR